MDSQGGITKFHMARVFYCFWVLLSVANKLVNARVRWLTDNDNVMWILQVGSKKPHLQNIAWKVLSLAIHFKI